MHHSFTFILIPISLDLIKEISVILTESTLKLIKFI